MAVIGAEDCCYHSDPLEERRSVLMNFEDEQTGSDNVESLAGRVLNLVEGEYNGEVRLR